MRYERRESCRCRGRRVRSSYPAPPRSLQSKRGLPAWKGTIQDAVREQIPEDIAAIQWDDVAVQIFHFCESWGDTEGDLDNIAKPILDALCDSRRVIFNDNQVKEILLRRIEWERRGIQRIESATPVLAERFDRALRRVDPGDFVYIFVTTWFSLERLP